MIDANKAEFIRAAIELYNEFSQRPKQLYCTALTVSVKNDEARLILTNQAMENLGDSI